MAMIGAELFVMELKARGLEWISTLCGHGLTPLYAACRKAGLRLVDTRNEQTAAYMAEAWGRLSRHVGVCVVSSGVAHANAMTGVVNAYFDGAPMLLVTGAGAFRTAGMGHFQDLDQVALAKPVCKYARVIDVPERIPQFVHEAFVAAVSGRPGPVHLTFPVDVQEAAVDTSKLVGRTGPVLVQARKVADESLIAQAADLLGKSQRPLLVAGTGAYYAGAEQALADFVASQAVPVVVPIWDRGAVPKPIPQFAGVLGAASGGPRLLADADLVLMAGAAFDYRVGYLQPPSVSDQVKIVRVDPDSTRLHAGMAASLTIEADPCSALKQLTRECRGRNLAPHADWLADAQRRRDEFKARLVAGAKRGNGVHALDIIEALRATVTEETILVVDGGNIGQWFHQMFCDRYPSRYLTCGASAVVGFGIAGAMAAKAGFPDRPVILLSGDGSMTFTIADLECAARQGLPFLVIVADDEAWGITATAHLKQLGRTISSTLGPIRFDLLAQSLGARGARVSRADEIIPAIREALSADRPTVIHVPIVGGMPGE
jgi:acetolactate synthase-1/2/3 large subunit